MQFDQNPTDRKIRELLKEKDKSLNDQLKKKMELREEQLKAYLQKSQAPISEDPTVVSNDYLNQNATQ